MPISSAKAYANNEIAFLAWSLDQPIPKCLGFELTRIYTDTGEERVLPAWVAFKGQRNEKWLAQTTSVWPIQKLFWRDLTVRKRRDATTLRPADLTVKYRIRPLVPVAAGLQPVTKIPKKTYTGDAIPLAYADEGITTNEVLVTAKHGEIRATFTNGILAAQWLTNALQGLGQEPTPSVLISHISNPADPLRRYLTGDVLGMLRELLERAKKEKGSHVALALYELTDPELIQLLTDNHAQVRLILSNTGASGKVWDNENRPAREALRALKGIQLTDRLFNNGHIGHNKFAVLLDAKGKAKAVLTGSTNWTPTGLCGQSNNAMIIDSPAIAARYLDFWNRLLADTKLFTTPAPVGAPSSNAQGPLIRATNATPIPEVKLKDGSGVTLWCAPNTQSKSKLDVPPPDLAALFSLMRKAEKTILFAVFQPSRSGKLSIIEEAINLGIKDPTLNVYGAISDPTAMPNYVAPATASPDDPTGGNPPEPKTPSPSTFDRGNVHVVRATAMMKNDLIGDFERELLTAGKAIIHDKIVVVDPLSDNGFVAMGSHNMGYKASYENDENMLIIRRNKTLVQAYAVHVMDVYEHYRFRAIEAEQAAAKPANPADKHADWDGFLSTDDHWLARAMDPANSGLSEYFAR
ncbi:MAG: phospholipase D-like domain-containing protein [Gemmatimonadota bacterium]|nr:phospholipase D-like domain-containing protein [Gemmatimonadota bacterium]